jgi:glyoxylase-like metal-dependent hydrolase (beta-lactamase superfamily II)
LLTPLNKMVSIIDTRALGEPMVVAAFLVRGKETALIDMGYQSSAETIMGYFTEHGSDHLDYLLPTHVHLDHCGALGTLAKTFTNASILVHPKGERHLVDPSALWKGAGELFGDELMRKFGRPQPVDQKRLRIADDGDVIDLGNGVRLRIVWTPGHASHHLSYELEGHRAFFTGDAVGLCYPGFPILTPTTPPTSFNLEKAIQALELIRATSPLHFYTPHYGIVGNAMEWINRNVESLNRWRSTIQEMMKKGLSAEQMSHALTDDACNKLGRAASDTPDYFHTSIKISVLGFLRYFGE